MRHEGGLFKGKIKGDGGDAGVRDEREGVKGVSEMEVERLVAINFKFLKSTFIPYFG